MIVNVNDIMHTNAASKVSEKEPKFSSDKQPSSKPPSTTHTPAFSSATTNDPFLLLPSSSGPTEKKNDGDSANPFQLDPFLFPQQPGANSFNLEPGADPFALPPLPNDATIAAVNLGPTVFDDLGQLDTAAASGGGGNDLLGDFNFDIPLIGTAPSTNGTADLPPLVGNPIGNAGSPSGLNTFDLDLLDDRLFDTLVQLEVQDGNSEKRDLGSAARGGQPGLNGGATANKLSKQEFDDLWDGISAAMPTLDS